MIWCCKKNRWNKNTDKGSRIESYRKETFMMTQNKMVQSGIQR